VPEKKKENPGRLHERVTEKMKARAWRNESEREMKQDMEKKYRPNPGDEPKWNDKAQTRLSRRPRRYRAETEHDNNAINSPPGQ
tara:strand:+ start:17 stop:268 length:252 start_codon:yes stop_codon:yes gene_type:complete